MPKLATKYDVLNATLFVPAGGSRRLRRALVSTMGIARGQRVLELGCGTGQVTAALTGAGANVLAVDALASMLDRARERAPDAAFLLGDITDAPVGGEYDHVVLAFVLHSFDSRGRIALLGRCAEVLTEGGRIGILDWARPRRTRTAALWQRVLSRVEPHPTGTREILAGALPEELAATGFRLTHHATTRSGQAQTLCADCVPSGRSSEPQSSRTPEDQW